jgi:hypothetical protein
MAGKKENHQKDLSPKKTAASPRRGQKNKQSKANSGEKVVKNKPPPSYPAITRKSKATRTQPDVEATLETTSKKLFQPPSDSDDGDNQDSDDKAIEEETQRVKSWVGQVDEPSDAETPNHQANQFLKIKAGKEDN